MAMVNPKLSLLAFFALCAFQSAFIVKVSAESHQPYHECILRDNPTVPKRLPSTRINDNYCDCQDGSDEPLTPACPGTKFRCINAGHVPISIPSSWVSDSHCDCCDGSDEPTGRCANSCAQLNRAAVADANRRADVIRRGIAIRSNYEMKARRLATDDRRKLASLQRELTTVTASLELAKNRAAALKSAKDWHVSAQRASESPSSSSSSSESEKTRSDDHDDDDVHDDDDDDYNYDYENEGDHSSRDNTQSDDEETAENAADVDTEGQVPIDDPDGRSKTAPDQTNAHAEHHASSADKDDAVGHEQEARQRDDQQAEADGDEDGDEDIDELDPEEDYDDDEDDDDDDDNFAEEEDEDFDEDYNEEDYEDDDDADLHEKHHQQAGDDAQAEEDNIDDDGDDDGDGPDGETSTEVHEAESDEQPSSSSKWTKETASSHDTDKTEETDPNKVDVDAMCAELEGEGKNAVVVRLRYLRSLLYARLRLLLPAALRPDAKDAISNLDTCIRQANDAKYKLESRESDLKDEVRKLEKRSSTNYGPNEVLRSLHGTCTKVKVLQYEFEHCPFDLVRQYEHGSAIATLGRYRAWTLVDGLPVISYGNGDRCWNGPTRSIKVQLQCGDKEDIISVDEPNRCSYFMKFKTPAVCEQKMIDDMMAEVAPPAKEDL